MIPFALDPLLVSVFVLMLAAAAWTDATRFMIPNLFPVVMVALWPLHVLALGGAANWPGSLLAAAVVLGLGFVAFARGWCGGGDVKLLVAVVLWFDPVLLPVFLFKTAILGMVLALLVLRGFSQGAAALLHRLGAVRLGAAAMEGAVPYGVAIAGGAFWTLFLAGGLTP